MADLLLRIVMFLVTEIQLYKCNFLCQIRMSYMYLHYHTFFIEISLAYLSSDSKTWPSFLNIPKQAELSFCLTSFLSSLLFSFVNICVKLIYRSETMII